MQPNNDVLDFDRDIAEAYEQADAQSAVDFGEQFADPSEGGAEPAPAADAAQAAPDAVAATTDAQGIPDRNEKLGVGRDIAIGVMSAPRSAARGAVKGINNMVQFLDDVLDYAPTIGILNEEGELALPRINTRGEAKRRLDVQADKNGNPRPQLTPQLPVPDAPGTATVTGGLIESVTQFATGFKGADKIIKGVGIAANAGKAVLGDILAFDAHEERLSNVIQQVPELQNPVTEYLQADPADGKAEAVFKQSVEALGMQGVGEAIFKGVKLLRSGKKAKAEFDAAGGKPEDLFDTPAEEAAGVGLGAKDFKFLGDAEDDAMLRLKQQKLVDAEDEVVGAFGKPKQIPSTPSPKIDDFEINFARIEGPDDIKRLMDDMVNKPELKESIDAARRSKRDNRATLEAATDIDGYDALMARRTGDAFNAEQIIAGRKVYYDTTSKLMEAAKRAASPDASAIDQFNFRKMVTIHHAVQKEFMGIRAEAGRALQAWRVPLGGTAGENLRAMENLLTEFGGEGASKELARRLAQAGNNLNTSQINAITQKGALARSVDAVTEAWTLGLLTNPTTHVVNVSSNVLTGFVLGMERVAAAFPKDSPVTLREGVEFFTAMLESQKLAIKNAAQAFRTGETGFGLGKVDLPRTRNTARDILDPEGKAGVLSKAMDGWGAILSKHAGGLLAAGDEYSKTVLYQSQTRALAMREGISKGLDGDALTKHIADTLANPPPALRADATAFAQYGTFTKELGKSGQAVQRIIADHPALRFVAPFVRTPANLFKFAFERTPLAALSSKVRADIQAGGARRATALSRIGMGTSVMALGADQAMQGNITGSGPADQDARAALRRTGWQPYSIKIGDTWYSYARFEPVATLLGMSADIAEIITNYEAYDLEGQERVDEIVTASVMAIGNQVVGKTFLTGLADLTEVLSDPKRYGAKFLQKFAGSFVPAGSAAIERAINPEMEQVFNMSDSIRARLPGASAFVPKRRNIWGEEIQYFYPEGKSLAGATAERLGSLFNPVYYSREKDSPVDSWMLKNGFRISMPDKVQTFDAPGIGETGRVRVDLREYPKAYERLVELRGNGVKLEKYGSQTMRKFFENLATEQDPFGRHVGFFLSIGNNFDDQQNFIRQVVTDYANAAQEQVLEEFPELGDAILKERNNQMRLDAVRPSILQQGGEQ
jgi:hypothetical protein